MDGVVKETHVVSVMNQHLATSARIVGQKGQSSSPHSVRRPRLTEKYTQKVQATEEQSPSDKSG